MQIATSRLSVAAFSLMVAAFSLMVAAFSLMVAADGLHWVGIPLTTKYPMRSNSYRSAWLMQSAPLTVSATETCSPYVRPLRYRDVLPRRLCPALSDTPTPLPTTVLYDADRPGPSLHPRCTPPESAPACIRPQMRRPCCRRDLSRNAIVWSWQNALYRSC